MKTTWQGWGSIEKVEERPDGSIVVQGIASHGGVVDSQGEVVTAAAMKAAIPDYMRWGAIREMHQPLAAGTALEMYVDRDGVTRLEALIVDSEAVKKVKAGVYKGFSIGGKVTRRDPQEPSTITGLSLVECSLVDRPANPAAVLSAWKADAPTGLDPGLYGPGATRLGGPVLVVDPVPEPAPSSGEPAAAAPRTDPTSPAEAGRRPQEEHHRGECPECGSRLVCVTCRAAVVRPSAPGAVDKVAGVLLSKVQKLQGERDGALRKLAGMRRQVDALDKRACRAEGERDAANAELRRRPKGALRDTSRFLTVTKADDGRGEPPEPEADDAFSAIKAAHRRPMGS